MKLSINLVLACLLCLPCRGAETLIEENVVYGMHSGLALLMDVHQSKKPNGKGIIFIQGCGWHSSLDENADPLKAGGAVEALAKPLAEHGFTVFTINHRTSPTFHYPAHVHDAQRAVRWIREHASDYGIDASRLAAVGGSSGGHLSLMLGLLPGKGDAESTDPVDRHDSKVQCVVALAPPTDLAANDWPIDGASVIASFIGKPRWPDIPPEYYEASPVSHIKTHGGTKFLLIHGDADDIVLCSQSKTLEQELRRGR